MSRWLTIFTILTFFPAIKAWCGPQGSLPSVRRKDSKIQLSPPACNTFQKAHKDCLLKSKNLTVSVTKDKINFFDEVDRSIVDLPITDENSEWTTVELLSRGKHNLLQLKIWRDELADLNLQSLNWFVYELLPGNPGHKVSLVHQGILQKRRKADKIVKDPPLKHEIVVNSSQNLVVVLGSEKFEVGEGSANVPAKKETTHSEPGSKEGKKE